MSLQHVGAPFGGCAKSTQQLFLRCAFCLLLYARAFNGITGFLPGVQSTEQSGGVINSLRVQCEHRTGARMFGRSSTVSNDHLVLGQFAGFGRKLGRRDQDGAFDVALFERRFGSCIDDQNFSLLPKIVHLRRCYAACIIRRSRRCCRRRGTLRLHRFARVTCREK